MGCRPGRCADVLLRAPVAARAAPIASARRGQVEIIKDVELLKVGDRVGSSEAALLAKLNIRPFEYALQPLTVFENGSIYDAKVLDITDDDLVASFRAGVK